MTKQEQQIETKSSFRIYLQALLIGIIVGIVGSAFHYCLDNAPDIYHIVITLFAENKYEMALFAALLSSLMVALAFTLVHRFSPESAGSGIQEIEGAMIGLRVIRWHRILPVKFIGGVLSMASGLVLGREGPTIHLGGSIGKMVAEKFNANKNSMNTLLAAGAAAGLSVAFSAPLGAILFVTEEMRQRFNYSFVALHAVIISSITAKLINDQVFGMSPDLPAQLQRWLPKLPSTEQIVYILPLFILLGLIIGLLGAFFNTVLLNYLNYTDRLQQRSKLIIAMSVGAIAGALLILQPVFVSGGESLVKDLFTNAPTLSVLLTIFLVRLGMTFLSYAVPVPGGIFAPMLSLGALAGLGFGLAIHEIIPLFDIHAGSFAIAAMAGLFAATVRAPLTGIILVSEMTASFELLPALIVTCMVASITTNSLGVRPIYDLLLDRTLGSK